MSLHRITAPLALGLVLSVVAAPTAFAEQDLRSPDTRDAAAAAAERYTDLRNPDTRDLPKNGAHPELTVVEVPVAVPAADSGLDWGDAGIGAGAMLGLILLATSGTLAVTHRKDSRGRTATTG